MKTVSLLWIQGLLQAAALQGVNAADILREAQVELPENATDRLSLSDTISIWQSAVHLSEDPLFGFHMGLSLKPTHFQLIAFTMISSATLGDAIEKILKYQRLISDGGRFTLVDLAEGDIGLVYSPAFERFSYHQIDVVMAAILGFARWLLDDKARPKEVLFTHGELGGIKEYQDFFGCDVSFKQDQNCIVFSAALLEKSLPGFDQQLSSMHEQLADSQLLRLSEPSIIMRLQEVLQSSPEVISRDRIAQKLGMSGRSLQRKLQQEGSSFQSIYDEHRHQRSLVLLQNKQLSLTDIAQQLGFSENSTFYRAFKRWQGITPGEYRQSI